VERGIGDIQGFVRLVSPNFFIQAGAPLDKLAMFDLNPGLDLCARDGFN